MEAQIHIHIFIYINIYKYPIIILIIRNKSYKVTEKPYTEHIAELFCVEMTMVYITMS